MLADPTFRASSDFRLWHVALILTGISPNSTVNFGNNTAGGSETVVITGDLTGAATLGGTSISGIAMTTLGNVVHASGDQIVFNNAASEVLAGTNAVNVTAAGSSFAKALDIPAAAAAASQGGGRLPPIPASSTGFSSAVAHT